VDTRTDLSRDLIGQSKFALDTPALLVDLDVMEANIARIVATCRAHGVAWRPHSKAHKTPEIAHMQIAAGAIGVTCAKLGEAEVMAAAGIREILIANQIVGSDKIGRLVRLAEQADPLVCVDSVENLIELDAAFGTLGKPLRVAIEVNIGMNRAGIEPGPSVAAFAQEIANRPGLRLVGVVGWESQATTIADPAEKERTVRNAVAALTASAIPRVNRGRTASTLASATVQATAPPRASRVSSLSPTFALPFGCDGSPGLMSYAAIASTATPASVFDSPLASGVPSVNFACDAAGTTTGAPGLRR